MKEELINYNKKISEFDYKKLSAMKSLEAGKKKYCTELKSQTDGFTQPTQINTNI